MEYHDKAVRLLMAVMRSVSTEKVRPMDWWVRGQSAMHGAAAMANSYGELVSTMGKKLQVECFCLRSAEEISRIGDSIDDFESFRHTCERDALYVAAEAQALRALEREERDAKLGKTRL